MLKTYLNTLPYTKFILIEDNLQERGKNLFDFIVKKQIERSENTVQYLVCEGSFERAQQQHNSYKNVNFHDFVSNSLNWTNTATKSLQEVCDSCKNSVVVIDSLAQLICLQGLGKTYQVLNDLKNKTGVVQIISLLHRDLLLDSEKVVRLFEHLCSLSISVEPKFISNDGRIRYKYKKPGGKIINQIEEYRFDGVNLITEKLEKLDVKKLEPVINAVNPENLSTFKIGLTESEKVSRDNLVLPYLPKSEEEDGQSGGKIIYNLEDVDDWDEEDPDDDLDI